MRELKGACAIITGASRGLGRHIARALAGEGMRLVLAARDAAGLAEAAGEVRARGAEALVVPTDVADADALAALVAAAEREFGGADVVVNNAGIELALAHHKLAPDEIEGIVRVNLTAPLLLTRFALPGMLARRRGHVVNIASLAAKACPPYEGVYAATKAGLLAFTHALRGELRGRGVGASAVLPGFVSEAGMYADSIRGSGVSAPALVGEVSPAAVARAVVRAIRRDLPEVLVTHGPVRLLAALGQLYPPLVERVTRASGAAELFRRVAERRERERAAEATPSG
jgi:short-subunit dehydrogenase